MSDEHPHAHSHHRGIAEPTKSDLLRRLARIRGQVEGIRRMVEEERYCPEIMQQFAAVRSGLAASEKLLFANHLEGCATQGLTQGGEAAREVRQELLDLFYRYMK